MSYSLLNDSSKTHQSSEAATNTKLAAAMKLDQLPEVILRRVFEFLLSAKEVRQPAATDAGYVVKYHFHPAIMRVNKSVHFLAQAVFRLNHFVLISTNWVGLTKIIDGYGLWIWRNKLVKFKQYHARMNIQARGAKPRDKLVKYLFFLVCLEQILGFSWILHMFELGSELSMAFKFEIKPGITGSDSSMPLLRQHDLLDPLTKIQGCKQTCSVSGAVDLTLAKRIETFMSPTLIWTRARAWAAYDIVTHLKHRGDGAFRDHNFRFAHTCWSAIIAFCTQIHCPQTRFTSSADANLHISRDSLVILTCINMNLARLYMGRTEDDTSWYEQVMAEASDVDFPPQSVVSAVDLARNPFMGAVAAFALRKTATAHRIMSDVVRQIPGIALYQQGFDIVSSWIEESKIKKKTRTQRKRCLETLIDILPKEPLASPKYLKKPIESGLAFESYVLERLGYHGDKLTWLVEHARHDLDDPQILNRKDAHTVVEEVKKELADGNIPIIIGKRHPQPQSHNHPPVFGFALPMPGPNSGMTPEVIRNMADMLFG